MLPERISEVRLRLKQAREEYEEANYEFWLKQDELNEIESTQLAEKKIGGKNETERKAALRDYNKDLYREIRDYKYQAIVAKYNYEAIKDEWIELQMLTNFYEFVKGNA